MRTLCQAHAACVCLVSLGSTARLAPVPVIAPPVSTEASVWTRRAGRSCVAVPWATQGPTARSDSILRFIIFPLVFCILLTYFDLVHIVQVVVDLCNPNPCQQGVPCQSADGGYTCACPEGYYGNECTSLKDPCHGQHCPGES